MQLLRVCSHLLFSLVYSAADGCKDGGTALHVASEAGQTKCVELLLNAGAQINLRDENGIVLFCSFSIHLDLRIH